MKFLLFLSLTFFFLGCKQESKKEEPPEIKVVQYMYHDTYDKTTTEDKRYLADASTCVAEIHVSTGAAKVDQTGEEFTNCLSNLGWVKGEIVHLNAKTNEIVKTIEM